MRAVHRTEQHFQPGDGQRSGSRVLVEQKIQPRHVNALRVGIVQIDVDLDARLDALIDVAGTHENGLMNVAHAHPV